MHALNITDGGEDYFDCTESDSELFRRLIALSEDGINLRLVFEDEDERDLFESRFGGEHIAVFMNELRHQVGTDDNLTYKEDTDRGADEYFAILTYLKTDL